MRGIGDQRAFFPPERSVGRGVSDARGEESDVTLWKEFRNGDESAFLTLYKQYVNVLFNYGCQFCRDREMIKDCLQDFFIYLRKNREGLKDTPSLKMYLFKAFRRRVVDYLNKHKREHRHHESFAFAQFPVELSTETVYINKQMEHEQISRLNTALEELDSKEREAIYYFYYESLSYEQIREIFDFSHVSSARRLIYRGLDRLRKLLRYA
jgi:RNA polymerase sigma-70 factor (ECF subfamily)